MRNIQTKENEGQFLSTNQQYFLAIGVVDHITQINVFKTFKMIALFNLLINSDPRNSDNWHSETTNIYFGT